MVSTKVTHKAITRQFRYSFSYLLPVLRQSKRGIRPFTALQKYADMLPQSNGLGRC